MDEQIVQLQVRRDAITGVIDPKAWDFAMKEMREARSYLQSMGVELTKATRETWDEAKDKVGEAWKRSQLAVDKMNATVTSCDDQCCS